MSVLFGRSRETAAPTVWQQGDFRKLWGGESLSLVGSEVTLLAIPLVAVLLLQASPLEVSLLSGIAWLPSALALPLGIWLDRARPRPLLILANLGRAGLLGLIPLAALGHWLNLAVLFGVTLGCGLLNVLFTLGYGCYLPTVVRREQLVAGNSALQTSASIAKIGGPGLAGLLIGWLSAPLAIVLDALSFVLATVGLLAMQRRDSVPLRRMQRVSLWHDLRFGVQVTWRQPVMRAMAGMACTYNLCEAVVLGLVVVFAVRDLRLSPTELGGVMALGSVGALVGALLAEPLARRWGLGSSWLWSTALSSLALLLIPLARGPVLLILAFGLNGGAQAVVNIAIKSLRAQLIPPHLLGRMSASYLMLATLAIPLGALLGGLIQLTLGVRLTMVLASLVGVLAAVWVIPVRQAATHRWEEPEPVSRLPVTA